MIEQTEKRILLTDNSFEAGGKTYIIHGSVNIERYTVLQNLEVQSAFGADFVQLHRAHAKWAELHNKRLPFDADRLMDNTFSAVARKANGQRDPLILICTLFMCDKDEDRTTWDEETANEKIKIWSEEGFPAEDFFRLALRFSKRYQSGLEDDSLDTFQSQPETTG